MVIAEDIVGRLYLAYYYRYVINGSFVTDWRDENLYNITRPIVRYFEFPK